MLKNIMYGLIAIAAIITLYWILRDKGPVFASAEGIVNSPVDKVWAIQTDFKGWSRWNSDIESMSVNNPIGIGTVFIWKAGGITIESTITEFEPPSRIAWKGKTLGIEASHVWVFEPRGDATYVRTEESFSGILPLLIPGTMREQLSKALNHGVEVLKKASEQ